MQGSRLHPDKKLSIIVTAHNLEDLIGRCLESKKNTYTKCLMTIIKF